MTAQAAHLVIVGGGIGGVSTAAALRAGGYTGGISLIERSALPYDRPPLSKDYLAGSLGREQIALQPASWYTEQRIDLLTNSVATSLDLGDGGASVNLADGRTVRADRVVLATGGRAMLLDIPGMAAADEAGRIHVLRDVEHADRLRTALQSGARVLVIGGGLIGAEIASTALSCGCQVTLVEPMAPPLRAVGLRIADWLHSEHGRHGIDTRNTTVVDMVNAEDGVRVQLADGSTVDVDAVVVGTGMEPDTDMAIAAGLDVDRGVLVDDAQVSSDARVLAVGDAAQRRGCRPAGHWESAQLGGQRAAATILGSVAPQCTAPWWWSDRHDVHVEGVGAMHEPDEAHAVVVRGTIGCPPFAAFTVRDGRVIGSVAVNDSQAVRAARRLIDREIEVDPKLLGDSTVDLRRLVRG